eukprot:4417630-Amphidinium_carterae.1
MRCAPQGPGQQRSGSAFAASKKATTPVPRREWPSRCAHKFYNSIFLLYNSLQHLPPSYSAGLRVRHLGLQSTRYVSIIDVQYGQHPANTNNKRDSYAGQDYMSICPTDSLENTFVTVEIVDRKRAE